MSFEPVQNESKNEKENGEESGARGMQGALGDPSVPGMIPLREDGRKTSATKRGASLACSGAFLAGLAVASGDPLLAAAGAGVLVGVAADFARSALVKFKRGGMAAVAVADGGRITSIAGETVEFSVGLAFQEGAGRIESFEACAPFEVVGFTRIRGGYTVSFRARPEVYGEYAIERLEAEVWSSAGFSAARVGLAPAETGADADAEAGGLGRGGIERGRGGASSSAAIARLRAYPRFYPVLIEALSLLGEGPEWGEAGAQAAWRLGRGMEYAWSREYEPWDSPRAIDWKATARRSRLCVKEFFEDKGRGAVVFFDGRASGRRSADEMARDLLSVVLGLSGTGQGVTLILNNRGGGYRKVEEAKEDGGAEGVLRAALAGVFEVATDADPEVFRLFPPSVNSSLLRLLKEEGGAKVGAKIKDAGVEAGMGMEVGMEKEMGMERGREGSAFREAAKAVKSGRGDLIYIGCPLYDAAEVLSLFGEASSAGASVRAFMPTKPWLDAKSLEEAYEVRVSWGKVLEAMSRATGEVRYLMTVPA